MIVNVAWSSATKHYIYIIEHSMPWPWYLHASLVFDPNNWRVLSLLGTLKLFFWKWKEACININSVIFMNRMDSLWISLVTWGLVSRLPWIFTYHGQAENGRSYKALSFRYTSEFLRWYVYMLRSTVPSFGNLNQ